jgi:hypothetical protein
MKLFRLRTLLPALWAGMLIAVGAVAAPAGFAVLSREDAGRVAGRLFTREGIASLVLGIVVVLLERRVGTPAMGANVLLALGAMFCAVAGDFALQPLMDAARSGRSGLPFGALHAIAVGFYLLKTALVLALAWRVIGVKAPTS